MRPGEEGPVAPATPGMVAAYADSLTRAEISEIWGVIEHHSMVRALKVAGVQMRAGTRKQRPSAETYAHYRTVAEQEERAGLLMPFQTKPKRPPPLSRGKTTLGMGGAFGGSAEEMAPVRPMRSITAEGQDDARQRRPRAQHVHAKSEKVVGLRNRLRHMRVPGPLLGSWRTDQSFGLPVLAGPRLTRTARTVGPAR